MKLPVYKKTHRHTNEQTNNKQTTCDLKSPLDLHVNKCELPLRRFVLCQFVLKLTVDLEKKTGRQAM